MTVEGKNFFYCWH